VYLVTKNLNFRRCKKFRLQIYPPAEQRVRVHVRVHVRVQLYTYGSTKVQGHYKGYINVYTYSTTLYGSRKYGSTEVPSKVLSYYFRKYFRTKVFYLRTKVLPYFRTCTSGSTSVHTSGSMHDSPMILPSFVLYLRTKVPSYLQYLFSKVFYSIYSMLLPYESTKVPRTCRAKWYVFLVSAEFICTSVDWRLRTCILPYYIS